MRRFIARKRRLPKSVTTAGILWGARIDGTFYNSCYSSPNTADVPFSGATDSGAAFDKFTTNAGKTPSVVAWGGSGSSYSSTFDTASADRAWNAGALSMYSLAASASQMNDLAANSDANGAITTLTAFAQAVGGWHHPIMIRFCWEMNESYSSPFQWQTGAGVTAANYILAWQKMHGIFAANAPNASLFFCFNHWFGSSSDDPATWFPGEAYVDWIGWDSYWGGKYTSTAETPSQRMDQSYAKAQALAPSTPIAIGEWGAIARLGSDTSAGAEKATYFTEFLGPSSGWLQSHPQVKCIAYFNDDTFEQTSPDDRGVCFEQDTVGAFPGSCPVGTTAPMSAWQTAVADSYFKAGGTGYVNTTNFPSDQKIPTTIL